MAALATLEAPTLTGPSVPPVDASPSGSSLGQLHRYNARLPSSYRDSISAEESLLLRALRTLAAAILQAEFDSTPSLPIALDASEDPDTVEGYERPLERDLAIFEKGINRFLDLKYDASTEDYVQFVDVLLRGVTTFPLDMALRAKLARSATRVASKRKCVLPNGIPFRPILDVITRVHIDCVDGGPFVGKDVRDSHCRSMLGLLEKSRDCVPDDETADKIYAEYGSRISSASPDDAFEPLLILAHTLPTRGTATLGWLPDALATFPTLVNAPDWDAAWMGLFARVAKHQPGAFNWSPHIPELFARIVASFKLPLGSAAPQSAVERRAPQHCQFLLSDRMISSSGIFVAYALSPKQPEVLQHFRRIIALVANFFHPSNGGRWTGLLGSFLHNFTISFCSRVTNERVATKAGSMDRVVGSAHVFGVAAAEDRLPDDLVDEIVTLCLPLVQHGLHSKSSSMTITASSASRDLAIIAPHIVVEPLLGIAAECLESLSSPHRTSAALKMLASLTPVFLDPEICPDGATALPQALTLTLPGIDPNDPGKTESTLRFIAGAAARIQSIIASGDGGELAFFVEDYTHQLLERVFALLDTLEAPPKKGRNGAIPANASGQLSSFIFAVSMNNLFAAVPGPVAMAAAKLVCQHITGSASINALKFYGALVRSVGASAAVASTSGTSASIFIPTLLRQLLVDSTAGLPLAESGLAPLSDDELVWRLRMLAQVCRVCGGGLSEFVERICNLVSLSFARSERRVYKAGGRLLRGLLEGLTSAKTALKGSSTASAELSGSDTSEDDGWSIEWNIPTSEDWKCGESVLVRFLDEADCLLRCEDGRISSDRDSLFRGLRLLHAIQRGGRWIMAGVMPSRFLMLRKFMGTAVSENMSKAEAKLALYMPSAAGLGGERPDAMARETAKGLWTRAYSLSSDVISSVVEHRPDDGALLYRCLEPLELAHEPFRRSSQGRLSMHACRGYKAAYHPVMATKRRFESTGGVGRGMPHFIFKLRIEAQHEIRLGGAARGGIDERKLFERLLSQVASLSVNAFPRVRGEARGVLTRGWRFAMPSKRREEIEGILQVLASAASTTEIAHKRKASRANSMTDVEADDVDDNSDLQYEIMIGAASVLRSAAAAPVLMRNWNLFEKVARILLKAIVVAERPDAASAVGGLFSKLAGLARPFSLFPFCLVGPDLMAIQYSSDVESSDDLIKARLAAFNDLNSYLIGVVAEPSPSNGTTDQEGDREAPSKGSGAHWRLQSLVATVLSICIREDSAPPPDVASFFAESMVSDVVSLRHISSRAIALILGMHGRRPTSGKDENGLPRRVTDVPTAMNPALTAIKDVLLREGFGRTLVHTLALDHDDNMGADGSAGGQAARSFGVFNFSRYVDGDMCWQMTSGRPWPSSWVSRSRDTLNVIQVRLYEAFCRVFGETCLLVFGPVLEKLVKAADAKEEKIIEGVRDDNVRVIAAELVAGMARGMEIRSDEKSQFLLSEVHDRLNRLLKGFSGPTGAVNGGTLIRFVCSASPGTFGDALTPAIVKSVLEDRPMVVAMGVGGAAHLQARRLRYIHSCIADLHPGNDSVAVQVMKAAIEDLTGPIAFGHELKNVREEVARLLAMLAVFDCAEARSLYEAAVKRVADRQGASPMGQSQSGDNSAETDQETRKDRSRQGETLSRWLSVVYWNGDPRLFADYLPVLIPATVASIDEESNQDRVAHARMALSLAAQGKLKPSAILDVVLACERIVLSSRYRIRGALLPFIQVFSFSILCTASTEALDRMRTIVVTLLSDSQLEVREAAGSTFIPLIRDAPEEIVARSRSSFLAVLKRTSKRAPRGRKVTFTPEELSARHGAVIGLGSMISSSPYDVPEWMPSVLVALTECINDVQPISTTTQKIFADFMRTHRDEWPQHKLAFSEEDLERVSELMVSPSYYA